MFLDPSYNHYFFVLAMIDKTHDIQIAPYPQRDILHIMFDRLTVDNLLLIVECYAYYQTPCFYQWYYGVLNIQVFDPELKSLLLQTLKKIQQISIVFSYNNYFDET